MNSCLETDQKMPKSNTFKKSEPSNIQTTKDPNKKISIPFQSQVHSRPKKSCGRLSIQTRISKRFHLITKAAC